MVSGKKQKAGNLGRSLIRDRFAHAPRRRVDNDSLLHTTEIQDGYDWGRLNLQSVTEESSFQEFLRTAELAGTEFQAEKLQLSFVNPTSNVDVLTNFERHEKEQKHIEKKDLIKIPRRPKWTRDTNPEELLKAENESFLNWRRDLATLQEDDILLTPYEKNLEFWRQLWRVVEMSDVVVQIVDARNPLLFRSEDLEKYVKEVDKNKLNMILINKADLLTAEQRHAWALYFNKENISFAFFSAISTTEESTLSTTEMDAADLKSSIEKLSTSVGETEQQLDAIEKKLGILSVENLTTSRVLDRTELIELFKTVHKGPKLKPGVVTIGLVGYPNVGKSSTINTLMIEKKVSVSATPGKTKHFQTLFLEKDILLCDCPGLVMPSFVLTKADMILNGILPIDQMRDHVPAVSLVCTQIPRHILEDKYGILIAKPLEGEDIHRPPHADELLLAHAYNRGFMTANGQPDQSRSARYILKDYVSGKLLYCQPPPTVPQESFNKFPPKTRKETREESLPGQQQRAMRINKASSSRDIDDKFFQSSGNRAYIKGSSNFPHIRPVDSSSDISSSDSKPWKHIKKEKREKLRKKFAYLDQH